MHRKLAPHRLRVHIVTVSTSRYSMMKRGESYTDESGEAAEKETKKAGHTVTGRGIISDDARMLRKEVKSFLSGDDDVLIFTGGTGVGELFRRLSYDEVGSAAVLSRATAGVAGGKLIVCLPGSPGAVRTALAAFIGEFPHVLYVARS
jgi:molybdenum cofactor biosynthesis protein B